MMFGIAEKKDSFQLSNEFIRDFVRIEKQFGYAG